MLHALDSDRATIATLRLRGRVADPLQAKLRVAMTLGAATLSPAAMAPASILVVRHLHDPLPGQWQREPGACIAREWEAAVRARLAATAARAYRPAHGNVPANADAVLFGDESELLACLASAWLHGETLHWWWRTLFSHADIGAALLVAWRARPTCIPGALTLLARREEDRPFVARLADGSVREWMSAVLDVHRCDALRMAVAPLLDERIAVLSPAAFPHRRAVFQRPDVSRVTTPPWRRVAADNFADSPLRDAFVGISAQIAAAPHRPHTAEFVDRVHAWVDSLRHERSERTKLIETTGGAQGRPSPVRRASAGQRDGDVRATSSSTGSARQLRQRTAHDSRAAASSGVFSRSPVAPARPRLGQRTKCDAPRFTGTSAERLVAHPPAEDSFIDTRFGGLFFLVNLGLFLELYGDFTTPRRPGIELPIWDFVALVGDALTGPPVREDALWDLLRELSGRPNRQRPGARFRPDASWRLPTSWLEPFTEGAVRAARLRNGRLEVVHDEGFVLLDVPAADDDSTALLERELEPYRKRRLIVGDARVVVGAPHRQGHAPSRRRAPTVRWWLAHLMQYVRCRLASALGVTHQVLNDVLMRRDARVHLTPSRIDVLYALRDLPIEVRLCGLDRDPGWVPAAGRDIRFHFE